MSSLKFSIIVASLFSFATPAIANPVCSTRDSLVKLLGKRYQEALTQYGISGQTNLVEIYVSKGGTFTILATRTDGISCIIAAGDSWEDQKKNVSSL